MGQSSPMNQSGSAYLSHPANRASFLGSTLGGGTLYPPGIDCKKHPRSPPSPGVFLHSPPQLAADPSSSPHHLSVRFRAAHSRTSAACPPSRRQRPRRPVRRRAAGESRLKAAIPVENPYCSCKLTRLGHRPQGARRRDPAELVVLGRADHRGRRGGRCADPPAAAHGRPAADRRLHPEQRRPVGVQARCGTSQH